MLLAVLFTFVLNRTGLFSELETTLLDTQMRIDMPAENSPVVIVDVTAEDFKGFFKSQTRPLNPDALQKLLEAIAAGGPCVVGVDVDTSFEQFKNFKVDNLSNFVWSRHAEMSDDNQTIVYEVLGRDDPALNEKSGVAMVDYDEKDVARFYSRVMETTKGNLPSFAWAVFKEAKIRKCAGIQFPDLEESNESLHIKFSRGVDGAGRARIPVAHILKFAENNWQDSKLLKDKIVLVGGSYLGEDKSETPLGMMNGVEVNANVLESDLRGGGVKSPRFLSVVLLQIFDGFLLIALFQIFSWRKAALLSLPLILLLSLACSFFTYFSFSHWAFFVPVMIGVALTELFEETKEHFKNRYKRTIAETYEEFGGRPSDEKQSSTEEE